MTRVLVVCTANMCRSPMAEALLSRSTPAEVQVSSAGVRAESGRPPTPGAVDAMARRGIDISTHRSRPTTPDVVLATDLVVTMESAHVVHLVAEHHELLDRTFTLIELVGLIRDGAGWPGEHLASSSLRHLRGDDAVRRHLTGSDLDVADPIGRSRVHYRRCAAQLEELCDVLGRWLS